MDPLPPASGLSAPPPMQNSPRSVPATKDPRSKGISPRSGGYAFTVANNTTTPTTRDVPAAKWPTASRAPAARIVPTTTTATKPLVPVTERKTHEPKGSVGRSRKESDAAEGSNKWDITPDGGSAGREGRQFAVANVGNNGRIYLRYVISPSFAVLSSTCPLVASPQCLN